jgi:hypothetical protein
MSTLPCQTIAREKKGRLYPCLPFHTSDQFYFLSPIWCKGAKKTQRGTLKPPIVMGNLEEDALSGVILKVNATNELSNQEHKVEKVLPTAHDVIFLEALLPL